MAHDGLSLVRDLARDVLLPAQGVHVRGPAGLEGVRVLRLVHHHDGGGVDGQGAVDEDRAHPVKRARAAELVVDRDRPALDDPQRPAARVGGAQEGLDLLPAVGRAQESLGSRELVPTHVVSEVRVERPPGERPVGGRERRDPGGVLPELAEGRVDRLLIGAEALDGIPDAGGDAHVVQPAAAGAGTRAGLDLLRHRGRGVGLNPGSTSQQIADGAIADRALECGELPRLERRTRIAGSSVSREVGHQVLVGRLQPAVGRPVGGVPRRRRLVAALDGKPSRCDLPHARPLDDGWAIRREV